MIRRLQRLIHFYFNKYVASLFTGKKYYLSFSFSNKIVWYRVAKVATRSLDSFIKENSDPNSYLYSSKVGYFPSMYRGYHKIAFVRHPVDRLLSAWRDKVCDRNYFNFDEDVHRSMMDLDNFIAWVEGLDTENCDEHICAQHVLIDMKHVDFIGRMETMESSMKELAELVGWSYEPLDKKNQSAPRNLELSEEQEERIRVLYARDLELFYPNG